jgi:hypothetical protein
VPPADFPDRLNGMLDSVEKELLEYDPEFSEHNTFAAQSDWTKSLVKTSNGRLEHNLRNTDTFHVQMELVCLPLTFRLNSASTTLSPPSPTGQRVLCTHSFAGPGLSIRNDKTSLVKTSNGRLEHNLRNTDTFHVQMELVCLPRYARFCREGAP